MNVVFKSSDNKNGGMAKHKSARPVASLPMPPSLRSDEDLKTFFSYFPEANICLLGEPDPFGKPPIERKWYGFTYSNLKALNESGYGIFFTACDVAGPTHKLEDFKAIRAWYCDIDVSSRGEFVFQEDIEKRKEKIAGQILFSDTAYSGKKPFLFPSMTIETRNGFHLYWFAWRDNLYKPSPKNFEPIQKKILEYFSADPKASKLVQLLRVPGFLNLKKTPGFPVKIREDLSNWIEYCEDEFEALYPGLFVFETPKLPSLLPRHNLKDVLTGFYKTVFENDIFKKVESMPQAEALLKLSGRPEVNNETYTFKPSSGKKHLNVYINGKPSSCFIDLEKNCLFVPKDSGRGSPNVIEWMKWYRDYPGQELADTLKQIFS